MNIVSDGNQRIRATVSPRSIIVNILDYCGGSATGTGVWDGMYGNGRVIHSGEVLHGTVKFQLLRAHSTARTD